MIDHLIEIIDEFNLDAYAPRLEYTIDNMLAGVKYNLNAVETHMVLLDAFYKHFKMLTSSMEDKLIGNNTFKEKQKLLRPKKLTDLIDVYTSYKIGDFFKISIVEFMQLNSLEIRLLLESAEDLLKSKNTAMEEYLKNNDNDNMLEGFGDA